MPRRMVSQSARGRMRRVAAIAVLCAVSASVEGSGALDLDLSVDPKTVTQEVEGSAACPCITAGTNPVLFAIAQAEVVKRTLPHSYGLEGCRAYDQNTKFEVVGALDCVTEPMPKEEQEVCKHVW